MSEYEPGDEINFDDLENAKPDAQRISAGPHQLHVLAADYYKNQNNNSIVRLQIRATDESSDNATVFMTVKKGNETQIDYVQKVFAMMRSCGLDHKKINALTVPDLKGQRLSADVSYRETNDGGDAFCNLDDISSVNKKKTEPEPARDFDDDIPF